MTVHLIKLCVGVETVNELADWQDERLKRLKRENKPPELCHRTLQTPRRRDEILDGGSLYWVIKGYVLVRQRIVDLRADEKEDGTACCGIVLHPQLVGTRAHPRRAFQGWRYLEAYDAPETPRDLPRAPRRYRPACAKSFASFGSSTGSGRGHRRRCRSAASCRATRPPARAGNVRRQQLLAPGCRHRAPRHSRTARSRRARCRRVPALQPRRERRRCGRPLPLLRSHG